jgi:hypothetical protein
MLIGVQHGMSRTRRLEEEQLSYRLVRQRMLVHHRSPVDVQHRPEEVVRLHGRMQPWGRLPLQLERRADVLQPQVLGRRLWRFGRLHQVPALELRRELQPDLGVLKAATTHEPRAPAAARVRLASAVISPYTMAAGLAVIAAVEGTLRWNVAGVAGLVVALIGGWSSAWSP